MNNVRCGLRALAAFKSLIRHFPIQKLYPIPMLLHADQLTKTYGRLCALDKLNLQINCGEILGLLGPNGSGKSTALRLFLGFLRPTAGQATIAGYDCWRDSVNARRMVAYLPGELRLYENMSGRQLVHFLGQLRQQVVDDKVDSLARRLDIDLDRPIAQLSSGMKRKVALLQVLMPRAPLLIMDEPTNTLDPTMRDELLAQLREARQQGQAVLFSSHVLTEVERVCDRVAILRQGQLVHLQDMSELREAHRIRVRFEHEVPSPTAILAAQDAITQAPTSAGNRLPSLPSMGSLLVRDRQHNQLILEQRGDLSPVLKWLAQQKVADLHIEPLGLSEIYHFFHGTAA
ncbi:MAG TPA: ABC transporter ATP-binding protein [Gemmataceae bacterium]|nr:ABC transporter ATP-binding protein [Gemmataceae bacterium]